MPNCGISFNSLIQVYWGSAEQFKRKFIQPIAGNNDKERQSQLRRLISPFLLRRTKSEVIEELPTKNDIYIPVELSSDEMTMYEVRRRQVEAAVLADNRSTLVRFLRLLDYARWHVAVRW